jgi:putative hydrolase of the HAD superfamily
LEILLQNLSASLSSSEFSKIQTVLENSVLEDPPTVAPQLNTILPKLSNRYKFAVISDTGLTPGRILRKILEKDNLINYFDYLTFSDEVGRSKPHRQAFLTTLNNLNVTPQEAAHIGDLLRTDIAGAKKVGMWAVQYVGINYDKEASTSTAAISPDAIIENYAELESWLQQSAIQNNS